jgi:hypothetical protein
MIAQILLNPWHEARSHDRVCDFTRLNEMEIL